jgi:hypothetical protein
MHRDPGGVRRQRCIFANQGYRSLTPPNLPARLRGAAGGLCTPANRGIHGIRALTDDYNAVCRGKLWRQRLFESRQYAFDWQPVQEF